MKKEISGKPRYYGRVDISACCDGVAFVREEIIDNIGKYGEDMNLDMVSEEELVDAILRHSIELQVNPSALDKDTGLPTLWHIQANTMFLERKRRMRGDGTNHKDIPAGTSRVHSS